MLFIKEDLTPNATEGCDERISFQIDQNDLLALKLSVSFKFIKLSSFPLSLLKRQLHRKFLNRIFEIVLQASVSRNKEEIV